MDNYVDELLKTHLGDMLEETLNEMAMEDEILQSDEAELTALDEQYRALELDGNVREIVDEYIECMQKSDSRRVDLGYIVGIRNTVKLLRSLDLLKGLAD